MEINGYIKAYLIGSGLLTVGSLLLALGAGLILAYSSGAREGGFGIGAAIYICLAIAGTTVVQLSLGLLVLWIWGGYVQFKVAALVLLVLEAGAGSVYFVQQAPWNRLTVVHSMRGDLTGLLTMMSAREEYPKLRSEIKVAFKHGATIDGYNFRKLIYVLDEDLLRFLLDRRAIEFGRVFERNSMSNETDTFLSAAIKAKIAPELLTLLLKAGGALECTDSRSDRSPTHPLRAWISALGIPGERDVQTLKALEEQGIKRDAVEAELMSVLEAGSRSVAGKKFDDDDLKNAFRSYSALSYLADPNLKNPYMTEVPATDDIDRKIRDALHFLGDEFVVGLERKSFGPKSKWEYLVTGVTLKQEVQGTYDSRQDMFVEDRGHFHRTWTVFVALLSRETTRSSRYLSYIWSYSFSYYGQPLAIRISPDAITETSEDREGRTEIRWYLEIPFHYRGKTWPVRIDLQYARCGEYDDWKVCRVDQKSG
jgi:hypothetical protein